MAVPQDARLATLTGQFDSIERRLVALEVAAGLNPGKAGPRPEDEPLEQQLGAEASPTQLRLAQDLLSRGVTRFAFRRVPGSYYSWPLEGRRGALDAATVHHLCVPWTGVCAPRAGAAVASPDPLRWGVCRPRCLSQSRDKALLGGRRRPANPYSLPLPQMQDDRDGQYASAPRGD